MSPTSSIEYSKPFLSLSYIWRKLCTYLHRHYHCLQTDQNEILHDPCHIGDPPAASKTIFKPKVCSTKIVHISCVKISTISKWTESSFHLSLVTKEYHRVRLKWFLCLWYNWRKLRTYLAPILTLSPNGPKWDSTWPTSPRSSIGCI
jgi:hypothetical protein